MPNNLEKQILMTQNQSSLEDFDIYALIKTLWKGKLVIIVFTVIGIIVGSIYLKRVDDHYTVSILLKPVQPNDETNVGRNLGNLASLAGVSKGVSIATGLEEFQLMLTKEEVSLSLLKDQNLVQTLFGREWNEELKSFSKPSLDWKEKLIMRIKKVLRGAKTKSYEPPNATRLAIVVDQLIKTNIDDLGLLKISSETSQPDVAVRLILNLINSTETLFRERYREKGKDAVEFYQVKIALARSPEHRTALAKLIAKEEQKLMLASSNKPFIAEIITGPSISFNPTFPNLKLILIASCLLGMFIGIFFVASRQMIKTVNNKHKT